MLITKVKNVRVEGICSCVPKNEIDNYQFGRNLFGDSLDGLIRATGVEKRRVCGDSEPRITTKDLCIKAAEELFKNLSLKKFNIKYNEYIAKKAKTNLIKTTE